MPRPALIAWSPMHTVYDAPAHEPATLDLPFYGASFGASVRRFFRKYAVFTGRASRSEFWWAMLFQYIVGTIAGAVLTVVVIAVMASVIVGADQTDPAATVLEATVASTVVMVVGLAAFTLPLLLPSIAVTVRRLHDTNRSGWWYLISLIPFGGYALYVFAALETDAAGSRFDSQRSLPQLEHTAS
ncbi:DUF805 domain-containing protein [Agromyces sp. SYSU K20354]|uniref:DUF805 domain-containing protein n=1 Tax=Agromyces cavernae TaxID=2898659 RepID=UPI001E42A8C7|nr:DUF805 domain-containing protein [Agromyces cavernae]MCD2441128.1 DUF805 domain-containing protein [Agromyces cavernae]